MSEEIKDVVATAEQEQKEHFENLFIKFQNVVIQQAIRISALEKALMKNDLVTQVELESATKECSENFLEHYRKQLETTKAETVRG